MVRFSRVRLAACPMCHPQVIRSRQWMRHNGGDTLKSQDHRAGLRALPLKVMECEIFLSCTAKGYLIQVSPIVPLIPTLSDVLFRRCCSFGVSWSQMRCGTTWNFSKPE